MKAWIIASVVAALALIALPFFFYKPTVNYFAVSCVSTIVVWSAVFAWFTRRRWLGISVGAVLQLAIQQVAYHAWLSGQAGIGWPLVQFIALQYVIALRLSGSRDETSATRS
jgi:hypothetical protein